MTNYFDSENETGSEHFSADKKEDITQAFNSLKSWNALMYRIFVDTQDGAKALAKWESTLLAERDFTNDVVRMAHDNGHDSFIRSIRACIKAHIQEG